MCTGTGVGVAALLLKPIETCVSSTPQRGRSVLPLFHNVTAPERNSISLWVDCHLKWVSQVMWVIVMMSHSCCCAGTDGTTTLRQTHTHSSISTVVLVLIVVFSRKSNVQRVQSVTHTGNRTRTLLDLSITWFSSLVVFYCTLRDEIIVALCKVMSYLNLGSIFTFSNT